MKIYEGCKIGGPYLNKLTGRLFCKICFPDGKTKQKSYPNYLMEVHLGRYLEENETVHHIDGNPLDNDINNLQVLDRKVHCSNDVLRNEDIKNRNRVDRHQSGYFCSRTCSGKYGSEIQLGKRKPTTVDRVVPNKYRLKSALNENSDVEAG